MKGWRPPLNDAKVPTSYHSALPDGFAAQEVFGLSELGRICQGAAERVGSSDQYVFRCTRPHQSELLRLLIRQRRQAPSVDE